MKTWADASRLIRSIRLAEVMPGASQADVEAEMRRLELIAELLADDLSAPLPPLPPDRDMIGFRQQP